MTSTSCDPTSTSSQLPAAVGARARRAYANDSHAESAGTLATWWHVVHPKAGALPRYAFVDANKS